MWLNFDSLCLRIVKAVAKHGACNKDVVYKYIFNYNGTVEKIFMEFHDLFQKLIFFCIFE